MGSDEYFPTGIHLAAYMMQICGINSILFQTECSSPNKKKTTSQQHNDRPHTLETTVVGVYGWGVRIIPHSPQFSLMSVSELISMKIHLSTKALYGLFGTMSLSWSLAGPFPSTKPPNWLHHVCNRPHSFDMDTSREILQRFRRASREVELVHRGGDMLWT